MATNKNQAQSNRINIELVPATMWGKNVRAVISRENWDALRWGFYATTTKPRFLKLQFADRDWNKSIRCGICNAEGDNLELHEQWHYDDANLIQRLTGLIPICSDCHLSMHLGRATQLGLREKAVRHLTIVNNWTEQQTTKYVREAFKKWTLRSQNQYSLDLSWLLQWIPETRIHLGWLEQPKRWAGDRLDATTWAREILESDAVIVDTETTGLLDYSRVEVIELAVITMEGKVVYDSRFRPRYKIPKRVTRIHGITNDDVKNELSFAEEYTNITDSIHSKIAVAYKTDFDKGAIDRTCALYNLEPPECRWECAMHRYRAFKEAGKWLPLPESKHNALDDCMAVLRLLRQMAK